MKEYKSIIRRITPTEASRLQFGDMDDYLKIDGPNTTDSAQYKAVGNSWHAATAEFVSSRAEIVLRESGNVADGREINYATTCSGVECQSIATRDKAWKAKFFSEIEPFPCRVLAARYPGVPNLGDMTKLDGTKWRLDLFSGGTPCFTAGNMVLTETGYRPIETIKEGDMVVTINGNLRRVVKTGKKMADNVTLVKIGHRPPFLTTKNHPFYTATMKRDDRRKSPTYAQTIVKDPKFAPIGDATENTGVCLFGSCASSRKGDAGVAPKFPLAYNMSRTDIAEFAGWYVGDGYIRRFKGKNKKCVTLCLNEKKLSAFEARFGERINYYVHKERTAFKVIISCTALAEWLIKNFGELSHSKTIPAWLICCHDDAVRAAFLSGYKKTDGCDFAHDYGFTTTSRSLAYGAADMMQDGRVYYAQMPPTCVIEGRVCNQRGQYSMKASHTGSNKIKYLDGMGFIKLRWMKDAEPAEVYNIEVEDEHTYICNGFGVHNCQSVSVAGKRHGMAEGSETRSSLAFHWIRILKEAETTCALWENVAGVLSSNGGADFAWFIHRITEAGYCCAWRLLDGQWNFSYNCPRALPQRRKRVWLCAWRGDDWRFPVRAMFERSKYTGPVCPVRRTNEGEVIPAKGDGSAEEQDWGLFGPPEPHFTASSRADMIPLSAMPDEGTNLVSTTAVRFLRECGDARYCGPMFAKGFESGEFAVDDLSPRVLENIGCGAGVACGDSICLLTQAQWNAGLQLPWGVKSAPKEFDGTVSALSDVLLPWGDYLAPYVLSHRACSGILRRAEARGKKLDQILEDALHYQIAEWANGSFDWVDAVKAARKAGGIEDADDSEDEDGEGVDSDCETDAEEQE